MSQTLNCCSRARKGAVCPSLQQAALVPEMFGQRGHRTGPLEVTWVLQEDAELHPDLSDASPQVCSLLAASPAPVPSVRPAAAARAGGRAGR